MKQRIKWWGGLGDSKEVVIDHEPGLAFKPYQYHFDRKEVTNILQQFADDHALLSSKQDIEAFNKWMESNF